MSAAARSVDFYVLSSSDQRSRLKLACRLAEKAYLTGARVLVCSEDPAELAAFDELLWSFADRSFVPHESYREAEQWHQTPVLLAGEVQPSVSFEVLLNLGGTLPPAAEQAARILEIIDGEQTRLRAARERFRHYREQGMTPQTHHIAAEQAP